VMAPPGAHFINDIGSARVMIRREISWHWRQLLSARSVGGRCTNRWSRHDRQSSSDTQRRPQIRVGMARPHRFDREKPSPCHPRHRHVIQQSALARNGGRRYFLFCPVRGGVHVSRWRNPWRSESVRNPGARLREAPACSLASLEDGHPQRHGVILRRPQYWMQRKTPHALLGMPC
jgi:hypothetical protein